MIRKVFWVGVGVGLGVLVASKLGKVRNAVGQDGLNRAVGRFSDSLHHTADAFREGMTGREAELRLALGLDDAGTGARLPAPAHRG